MTNCYHLYVCDSELGEMDAFFTIEEIPNLFGDDRSGTRMQLIHWWLRNDASYKPEYMKGLFTHLGIDVQPFPNGFLEAKGRAIIKLIVSK